MIIGAGAVGCSLAYHLAKNAAGNVVVLERGQIGQGSTGANAGGVRAQFSTEVNIRLGIEAKRMLANFEAETGQSADFRPIGYLFLLSTAEERARFADSVRLQRRCGLDDVRELEPDEARRLVPGLNTDDLVGATFCPSDGLAGPNEVTFGYAKAARHKGVTILEETPVEGFLRNGQGVEGVRTPAGELRSRRIVICAGPWGGSVAALAGREVPIQPSRRHAFVTEKLPAISRRTPMTVDFHTSFYFHPEGDGALLGMSNADEPPGFNVSVDWSFLDQVSEVAARRWPPLLDARVKNAWAGLYEMTPDRQPLVGPMPDDPGLWIAAGFSGHGFMLAPSVGKQLATWMVDGKPGLDLTAFAPGRFEAGASQPERNVI